MKNQTQKYSPRYINIVHQMRCRLNTDKQINKTCYVTKNGRNFTEYSDIKRLLPKKDITIIKCVKHG